MLTEPATISGISGVVGISGALIATGHNGRVSVQVTSWDTPLHVGMGSNPFNRCPDAIVAAGSMWECPAGIITQQDLYLLSTSGEAASYQVSEFRR